VSSASTNFTPQTHGFRFVNRFQVSLDFELPLIGAIDLGDLVLGLCGGMCFAALDYFDASRPVPTVSSPPGQGTTLHRYLVQRQIDSLVPPQGVLKVLSWTVMPDRDVWRQTAGREFGKLRWRLDRGKPAVLALIRVGGLEGVTRNHQVVARAYDFNDATKQLSVRVYDPNHPGSEPSLNMKLQNPASGIQIKQSTGEPLRGFFVIDYRAKAPP